MKKLLIYFAFLFAAITQCSAVVTINPSTIDTGYCEHSYSFKCTATGGTAPYVYTVSVGTLPAGLFLNKSTGRIEGIIHLQSATSVSFTIRATDAAAVSGTRAYVMYIRNTLLTAAQMTTCWTGSYPPAYSNVFDTWYSTFTHANTNLWSLSGNALTGITTPFIGSTDSVSFSIRAKNVDLMTVKPTGYIGIGTTSPTSKLHLSGANSFRYQDGSQGSGKVLISDGNGVATWGVSNNWALDGSTVGSEQSLGTVDDYDLPIITNNIERARFDRKGTLALGNETNVDVFIGKNAGLNNDTTGFWTNPVIGTANTAVGVNASRLGVVCHGNTAIGALSLYSNTESKLVAVGARALYSNTTGTYNTGVGYYALRLNSTGSFNSAFGNSTLEACTGSDNCGFGAEVMETTTSGSKNIGIGRNSMYGLTTGSDNIGIGYQAGNSLTGGNTNLFVGYRSGYISTGSGNIFLGYSSGVNQTGSNKLLIDNQDRGSEANEQNKSLIYGVFDASVVNQVIKLNAQRINVSVIPHDSTSCSPGDIYLVSGALKVKY